jgi:branched-chain amino acid transport system permease protein
LITALSEILRNAELGIVIGPITIPAIYGISQILIAIIFILVIIFRPRGLLGGREIDFEAFWSWVFSRFSRKQAMQRKEVN